MKISGKQREANQKNGALGGVKTSEGKTISSKNAINHGILAHCKTSYDWIDLESVYTELADEFGDTTPSRSLLVQQLALTALRLSRCARAEQELLREVLNPRITEVRGLVNFNLGLEETVILSKGEPATLSLDSIEKFALIEISRIIRDLMSNNWDFASTWLKRVKFFQKIHGHIKNLFMALKF